jgi:hypothetical protein
MSETSVSFIVDDTLIFCCSNSQQVRTGQQCL